MHNILGQFQVILAPLSTSAYVMPVPLYSYAEQGLCHV